MSSSGGLFASISSSYLLAKLSLGLMLWSIINIFLTGILVENLSEKDMNELRSGMDSLVDVGKAQMNALVEEGQTKVVGRVKQYVELPDQFIDRMTDVTCRRCWYTKAMGAIPRTS